MNEVDPSAAVLAELLADSEAEREEERKEIEEERAARKALNAKIDVLAEKVQVLASAERSEEGKVDGVIADLKALTTEMKSLKMVANAALKGRSNKAGPVSITVTERDENERISGVRIE